MDPLADALTLSGVQGTLGTSIEAGGAWSLAVEGRPDTTLYAVTTGRAWLTGPGHDPVELATGDVVLLPAGAPHRLGDEPSGRGDRPGSLPVTTRIATIRYRSDPVTLTQILGALPGLVHVRAETGTPGLTDTVRMLAREIAHPGIGTSAVLKSLVDIVLVEMLRAWLSESPPECFGTWLGALGDPVVGRALEYLHQDPATPWTTSSLAEAIAVSRATLARRFPIATGTTPAAYLAQWRMDLAAVRLRDTHESLETIAENVGYGSVPAFTRAFTRAHGRTPGRYRSQVRTATIDVN
ncbi:AraC family transcriptional regulator [Kineosporia succinea]|uniref:AraC-like DNA-binding protein n=1 Tax=Kineosporia succinea TaxID=84632 RepID=A0ABT9PA54_9ACTN|nr:AraC family transcriptional regulator [Kineosporia succinea]MDP9829570.1 AraC-like DNA-binding protein [Kineosporia succinea]